MREDLFKTTMSADGLAGRRPYGLQMRMIELVGWKRYEVNSMIRLQVSVREMSHRLTGEALSGTQRHGSSMRPSLLARIPMRTETATSRKIGTQGFSQERTLRGSCSSIAARIRDRSWAKGCRRMIEDLASQPLTEDSMREACGLPPRHRSREPEPALAVPIDPSSQDEEKELIQKLRNVAAAIQEYCFQTNRNPMTKGMWKYVKLPATANHPARLDREMMWNALLDRKFFLPVIEKSDNPLRRRGDATESCRPSRTRAEGRGTTVYASAKYPLWETSKVFLLENVEGVFL